MDSILDKILTQKHGEEIRSFDPVAIVSSLLRQLPEREQEVVRRRFGVPAAETEETLEEIGAGLKVTRERIRQITKTALQRLQHLGDQENEVQRFLRVAEQLLSSYAGALADDYFVEQLLEFSGLSAHSEDRRKAEHSLRFLLNEILSAHITHTEASGHLKATYALPSVNGELLQRVAATFVSIVEGLGEPVDSATLVEKFRGQDVCRDNYEALIRRPVDIARNFSGGDQSDAPPSSDEESRVILAYAAMVNDVGQNIFDQWGRRDWTLIRPRRMNDKIYLILRHEMKPLHFTEIAERINVARFDKKIAKAPSVHNELILDKRFVLVGRGLYALKEWGFERGTVADVITEILKDHPPMSRDEIVGAVLESRIVKKQTIHLALMNKNKFEKMPDGKFRVVAESQNHGGTI